MPITSPPTAVRQPPPSVLTTLFGPTDAERWYELVRTFPQTAKRVLNQQRVPDPVMLAVLQAQAAMQLSLPREALVCSGQAVQLALLERPVSKVRLLAAATVQTGAAVVAGTPDAIAAGTYLIELANRFGDRHRAQVAAGLHAVAVFHQQGCAEAMSLLIGVAHACTEPEAFAALHAAQIALSNCCSHRREQHWPPAKRPPLTAGGWVPTALSGPFLADRLVRWPGIHCCSRRSA